MMPGNKNLEQQELKVLQDKNQEENQKYYDEIDDSDKDTGYGVNEDSDNQDRHGSLEDVSGSHNQETGNFIQTAVVLSTTASSDMMEQLDVQPPLSQEGCKDDQQGRRE